jgi:DNA-binding transcriptional LysR family regulator
VNLLRLTRLRHFCMVAERGSIGLAARVLHITQPALTRSIRKAEEEMGEPLFERTAQGIILTPLGRTLLPYAQAILSEADRALQECRNLRGERGARIKLGISPNFAGFLVPEALSRFLASYPDAHVEVQTGTLEQLLALLTGAQIDLALSMIWRGSLDAPLGRMAELFHEQLHTLPASVYAPAGHPLAAAGRATLEELQHQRWAVPHGISISHIFQGKFTSRGLTPPHQCVSTASLDLLIKSCLQLNTLTLVPQHLVREEVDSGRMVPLECPDLTLEYEVGLLMRSRGSRSGALSLFAQTIRECCHAMNGDVREADVRQPRRAMALETEGS